MNSLTNLNSKLHQNVSVGKNIKRTSYLTNKLTNSMVRVINSLQMALAESYINGLEIPDSTVKSILDTFIPILYTKFPSFLVAYDWVIRESNQLAEGSQKLMKIQYNLPTEMFKLMLGEGELIYPKYSMALWEKGALNLEQAQMQMLEDLITKLGIQDGDEILDLGCGWGSAANYILSKFPNATVTGLNLSSEQCKYMRQKMQDRNSYLSSGRFKLLEADFNQVQLENKFDKIITIGFFEHVGNLTQSFQKMASLLKENGKVFLHIISIRFPHNAYCPFLNKYIFPNMRIWNFDATLKSDRDLKTIDRWYINGSNYAKTLSSWLTNFDAHQEKIKTLNFGMDYAKFRRIWRLYLIWCIAYFEACNGEILGNAQYLMTQV
ncbi:Cyclopropane-fatty-acyl-phospholipid synthase [Stanieria cyanosphaera PCC 7437]|uniref:Cyclopropane-fatty-acyl-phospholipid synthase n=1 Tax=Stanieria cyanosphaera (strain ATCC 29371 / PCC 7437) TaxID=111780 RepID=K9XNP1_STAC7|nr:class I SAM-dependent methyltransferase [Stanieria cyanosphaera]AFZ33656.1 Cyclopropane-fatty-acyl-phospholipid synthase [Stanieria cyanosphaera PCC 7437]